MKFEKIISSMKILYHFIFVVETNTLFVWMRKVGFKQNEGFIVKNNGNSGYKGIEKIWRYEEKIQ